jgi:hypothetical protein
MVYFMLRLFRRKCFLKNIFRIFQHGVTENNSQIENIFGLAKKVSLVSENDLHF